MTERSRRLSEQGRELFSSALTITSDRPRSRAGEDKSGVAKSKQGRPDAWRSSTNAFQALQESDDEDEGFSDEEMALEPTVPAGPTYQSPKMTAMRQNQQQPSPRWEKVVARKPAKFALEEGSPGVPVGLPPPSASPAANESYYDDGIGEISDMSVDTKDRRDRQRAQYGKKSNQFKVAQQRMYSMAKRDEQRAADKARRGIVDEDEGDNW
jgi:hypothetical protein